MNYLISLLIIITFNANSYGNEALEIANSIKKANEGFVGETSKMIMLLSSTDEPAKVIKRSMKSHVLEVSSKESRTLLEFLLPKDVQGTKLLTWSFDSKDDSQWIYMPAFRKIKRISSSSKTSSFMGSEFTYEDLRSTSPEKYNFKFIAKKKENQDLIWKYERKSKQKSGYSKQVVTSSKKYMSVISVDYYNRSGELLKQARMSDFKSFKVGNKIIWRPQQITMTNVQTKKVSTLIWENRKLGDKLNKKLFLKNTLKK